jgi:hypothetical protein
MNLPHYVVGLYFLWASVTTLISRFFLNLREAGSSDGDWGSVGANWGESTAQIDNSLAVYKRQTHTFGSMPMNRASAKDDMYTIEYDENFEMHSRKEHHMP